MKPGLRIDSDDAQLAPEVAPFEEAATPLASAVHGFIERAGGDVSGEAARELQRRIAEIEGDDGEGVVDLAEILGRSPGGQHPFHPHMLVKPSQDFAADMVALFRMLGTSGALYESGDWTVGECDQAFAAMSQILKRLHGRACDRASPMPERPASRAKWGGL